MRRDPRDAITILHDASEGYGWAVAPTHLPEGSTYHHTFNWDLRIPGRAAPSLAPMEAIIGGVGLGQAPIVAVAEWEEASPFRPYIMIATGTAGSGASGSKSLTPLRDGSSGTTDSVATSNPYTSLVLYRNGDTEVMYAANGFGNAVLRTVSKALVFANATSTKADLMRVIGSDLYITNGYKIQKLIADADPQVSTNYLTAIPVGRATYAINEVVNVGGSPVVMKGDGLFTFDGVNWLCQTEMITPHPDHGKGGFTDGRGRAYYPTADGDIIVLQPGFQSQQRPVRFTTINRETPFGRITALTADMEHVYAATKPGTKSTNSTGATAAGLGLVVKSTDGGVFTTHTTSVTDNQFDTVADLTLLTSGTDEALYIGADEPFLGAVVALRTKRTNSWPSTKLIIEYASAGPAWQTATNGRDGTIGFCQDAAITVATDGSDLTQLATNPWVATTVDGVSKYWMRVYKQAGAGTGFAGVTIREVRIIPFRPPLDQTLFPISAYAIGGALPKILVGTWVGERIKWDDVWTVDAPQIDKLLIAHGEVGALPYGRVLYAFNHLGMYGVGLGQENHPAVAPWPKLADYAESGVAQDTHILWCSGIDLGDWARVTGKVMLDVPFLQSDDSFYVYSHMDEDAEKVFVDGPFSERSIEARLTEEEGRVLHVAVAFSDGSRDAAAPCIREIVLPGGAWEYTARPTRKADIAVPPVR